MKRAFTFACGAFATLAATSFFSPPIARAQDLDAGAAASASAATAPTDAGTAPIDAAATADATKLFAQALDEEREKKFADALEKLRRVVKTKDGARVRYHIATCLVGLGKLREARDAFGDVHASAEIAEEQDVELAAIEQKSRLTAKIGALTIKLTGEAKNAATIIVDGRAATSDAPLEVDPGEHVVVVDGPALKRVEMTVKVAPAAHQVTRIEVLTTVAQHDVEVDEARSRKQGFVVLGIGGALVATTLIVAFVRNDVINQINSECPQSVCPIADKTHVKSQQSAANIEGAVAVTTGIASLFAVGIGAYLVIHPKTQTTVTVAPTRDGAWLRLGGTF